MTEFNKIVRYLIPSFLLAGYSFLFISTGLLPGVLFYERIAYSGLDLTLLVTFAGSGGFVVSVIHHTAVWRIPWYPHVSYREFMCELEDSGLLRFKGREVSRLTEEHFWRIVNILWHRLRTEDEGLERLNDRNNTLTDLMHGNGASVISTVLAGVVSIVYLGYDYCTAPWNRLNVCALFCALILFLMVFGLHWYSYRLSVRNVEGFVQENLWFALSLRKGDRKESFSFYVPKLKPER